MIKKFKKFLIWIESLPEIEKYMFYLILSTTIVYILILISGLIQEIGFLNIWSDL